MNRVCSTSRVPEDVQVLWKWCRSEHLYRQSQIGTPSFQDITQLFQPKAAEDQSMVRADPRKPPAKRNRSKKRPPVIASTSSESPPNPTTSPPTLDVVDSKRRIKRIKTITCPSLPLNVARCAAWIFKGEKSESEILKEVKPTEQPPVASTSTYEWQMVPQKPSSSLASQTANQQDLNVVSKPSPPRNGLPKKATGLPKKATGISKKATSLPITATGPEPSADKEKSMDLRSYLELHLSRYCFATRIGQICQDGQCENFHQIDFTFIKCYNELLKLDRQPNSAATGSGNRQSETSLSQLTHLFLINRWRFNHVSVLEFLDMIIEDVRQFTYDDPQLFLPMIFQAMEQDANHYPSASSYEKKLKLWESLLKLSLEWLVRMPPEPKEVICHVVNACFATFRDGLILPKEVCDKTLEALWSFDAWDELSTVLDFWCHLPNFTFHPKFVTDTILAVLRQDQKLPQTVNNCKRILMCAKRRGSFDYLDSTLIVDFQVRFSPDSEDLLAGRKDDSQDPEHSQLRLTLQEALANWDWELVADMMGRIGNANPKELDAFMRTLSSLVFTRVPRDGFHLVRGFNHLLKFFHLKYCNTIAPLLMVFLASLLATWIVQLCQIDQKKTAFKLLMVAMHPFNVKPWKFDTLYSQTSDQPWLTVMHSKDSVRLFCCELNLLYGSARSALELLTGLDLSVMAIKFPARIREMLEHCVNTIKDKKAFADIRITIFRMLFTPLTCLGFSSPGYGQGVIDVLYNDFLKICLHLNQKFPSPETLKEMVHFLTSHNHYKLDTSVARALIYNFELKGMIEMATGVLERTPDLGFEPSLDEAICCCRVQLSTWLTAIEVAAILRWAIRKSYFLLLKRFGQWRLQTDGRNAGVFVQIDHQAATGSNEFLFMDMSMTNSRKAFFGIVTKQLTDFGLPYSKLAPDKSMYIPIDSVEHFALKDFRTPPIHPPK